MKITLGTGVDEVRFGMSPDSLRRIYGEPNKIDTDSQGLPLYKYNSIKSTFWFDDENRIHWIESSNKEIALEGFCIIGQPINTILPRLREAIGDKIEIEDFGSMESYSFDRSELEIQVEYGEVSQVCFGHYWENDDQPIYTNA